MKKLLFLFVLTAIVTSVKSQYLSVPGGASAIWNSGANGNVQIIANSIYPLLDFQLPGDCDYEKTLIKFSYGVYDMSINGDGSYGFGVYKSDATGHYATGTATSGALLKFYGDKFKYQFSLTKTGDKITSWVYPLEINRNGLNINGQVNTSGSAAFSGNVTTANDIHLNNNLIFDGADGWILHSRDDGTSLFLAPWGTSDWAWDKETRFDKNGNVMFYGNIGIGVEPNNHRLNIEGTIRAREVKVNTTGADFVFDANYKLRSLKEVEEFIKLNKHLPDIAPAAEMEANGANLGELQTKLLQKVEELTLYVIEQERKNTALQQRVGELEKQIKEKLQ